MKRLPREGGSRLWLCSVGSSGPLRDDRVTAAVAHREHLGKDGDRDLLRLPAAQVEADRCMQAGQIVVAEALLAERSHRSLIR